MSQSASEKSDALEQVVRAIEAAIIRAFPGKLEVQLEKFIDSLTLRAAADAEGVRQQRRRAGNT